MATKGPMQVMNGLEKNGEPVAINFKAISGNKARRYRKRKDESQEKFWGRVHVAQSTGSRFEDGTLPIPAQVCALLRLMTDLK
jgi:DNA-binding XRE family transcriptional regulator